MGEIILTLIFITLKTAGVINWNWIWVFIPIWFPVLLTLTVIGLLLALTFIIYTIKTTYNVFKKNE